jgi:hypothetical protein
MTDYQMRTIADALIDIGTALQEIGVSLLPPTSPDDLPHLSTLHRLPRLILPHQ